MKAQRIFTRQVYGLDYRVFRSILVIVLLAIGLLSYRLLDKKECVPINFTVKTITHHTDSSYSAGESLSFIAAATGDEITWDFGDDAEKVTGQYVSHKYLSTGTFIVTASTGNSCQTVRKIIIKLPSELTRSNEPVIAGEEIIGPFATSTGVEESFTCMVTATHYEWSIPNYPKMARTGSTAKFIFPAAGKFLVQVTLDHDRTKRYTKEITVEAPEVIKSTIPEDIKPLIPTEVQPLPDPKTFSVKISDAIFTEYLSQVIDKKMAAADFDKYLCYKGETKVVANGDIITFNALCEEISGKKRRKFIIGKTKIKINSAVLRRDNEGCVNIIEVKYR
ncbi:MAG: PKD domain-containing protein [Chitinophagaceae bacterium]|nr:PKD domain-containing protein [Chitinophagaceae bacterium]